VIEYPIQINEYFIKDILSNMTKITVKKIHEIPKIGLCNGLYATNAGLGGLTIIQVMRINSDKKFTIEKLTGSQGDVMKESMNCAMTLAWNILPDNIKQSINDSKEGFGLHIHCPEAATPKDGPSAGLCITLGIISRLTGIPVRNDLALTGEVDLLGNAHQIGGLYSKLQGAFNAGIKTVLIPRDNQKDLDLIFKREEEETKNIIKFKYSYSKQDLNDIVIENVSETVESNTDKIFFRNKMEIIIVDTIFDVLKYGLIDNKLEFIKDF
jgi:ATP-dependent Lon protease